jgi:hypothetical protein
MKEVEIEKNKYRVGRLDSFDQLYIAKRLAPLLTQLSRGVTEAADKTGVSLSGEDSERDGKFVLEALEPITQVLSELKDEDLKFVINTCLKVCKRHVPPTSWADIQASGTDRLMYEDMGPMTLLALAYETIRVNMKGFFPIGLPSLADIKPQSH